MTRALMVALVWVVVSAPLAADLKYTVRLESRKVPEATEVDPMLWMLGQEVLHATVPGGDPVEMTIMVGQGAARVQWNRALPGIPEGAVLLQQANGNLVMLDPTHRTYWNANMPNLYGLSRSRRPTVTLTPVDEPMLVAGVPATKADVDIVIPFVEAQRGEMVSGTPTELPLHGEVWTTNRYGEYWVPRLRPILGLPVLGLDVAPARYLVLRQVLRGPLFGEFELESVVTAISEEEIAPTLFAIPEGFAQVAPPRAGR